MKSLEEIFDWLYMEYGDSAILKIGIWDEGDHTFYAVVENENGQLIIGESTYDAETLEDALKELCQEIAELEAVAV